LEKKGHEVKVITYGQAYPILKKEGFDIFKAEGLHIIFKEGKLQTLETFKHGLLAMAKNTKNIRPLLKLMKEFQPEICISDMEPLVPILSFWHKLPLVSIDNQHRITNLQLHVPKKYYPSYLIAKLIIHRIVSRADCYIVTSFAETPIKKKNTLVVPPILRKEILALKKKKEERNFILVYLTKPERRIFEMLKTFQGEKFIIYGLDKAGEEDNLLYKKTGKSFLNDLRNCKAVIATAGFTLISEALFLQKPYFALPLQGQFEQTLNALFLKQAGYGDYAETSGENLEGQIQKFFANFSLYKKHLRHYHPDNKKIFKALDYVLRWLSKNKK